MASKCTIPNERGSHEYTKLLRTEVEGTIGVMEKNAEALQTRGEKTEKLIEIADIIKQEAKQFKILAKENKKKHMWENYKMIVIGCVSITVISSLVAIVLFFFNDNND